MVFGVYQSLETGDTFSHVGIFDLALCKWGGGATGFCWRPYSPRVSNLYLTRFRAYKNATPAKKNLGGEGHQTDKHLSR
jgi:hypothetical protein